MFDELLLRRLIRDPHFVTTMNAAKARAWNTFSDVVLNFLGNRKACNCQQIVEELPLSLQSRGCSMSIKFTLHSHLDEFPENLGDVNQEQGECFHQDIKVMENRCQGRWHSNMMADYC